MKEKKRQCFDCAGEKGMSLGLRYVIAVVSEEAFIRRSVVFYVDMHSIGAYMSKILTCLQVITKQSQLLLSVSFVQTIWEPDSVLVSLLQFSFPVCVDCTKLAGFQIVWKWLFLLNS